MRDALIGDVQSFKVPNLAIFGLPINSDRLNLSFISFPFVETFVERLFANCVQTPSSQHW